MSINHGMGFSGNFGALGGIIHQRLDARAEIIR
jgi:hypothetical protein